MRIGLRKLEVLPERNGDGFGAVGCCCCRHLLWNAQYGSFMDNLRTSVVTLMIGAVLALGSGI